ncbi:unnamed protein product [Arabidopsis thaliana]|uniref:Uncharacterized protein n=1 Tax=Arabidopsis thaliana TaxID=3702 RepID=A0A5S9V9R4_ARATH|nr:unnamed protein product [Arabidopsis thaliana]
MCVGFAVTRNRTTMRFKIVCILEMQTVFRFEISDGYSWRLSETTITPNSKSDLTTLMKPIYLDNTLHWLRNDGSIIAFNPETEEARLIPSRFRFDHRNTLFAANENINRLTLISKTVKRISVYTLLEDSKWALAKRIKNISMDKRDIRYSNVVAYDDKCLVLREFKDIKLGSVVHVYDMETNTWRVLGAICQHATVQKLYKITPSLFFVEEDDEKHKVVVASNDQHIYLNAVLGVIDSTNYGATYIFCQPLVSSRDSMSPENEVNLSREPCYIFGSCSGLPLLYIGGLFVVNPLTKRFRLLDHSGSKLLPIIVGGDRNVAGRERGMCVGFTVNGNRTTKRFKIVCIHEMGTVYSFELSDGYSWRLSETTVTASSKSNLTVQMKHVYFNNTLHWLRNDGSIITFNPETEQARLIPSIFHQEPDMKLLFAADNNINRLILISGTKEEISVYTLLDNSEWTVTSQIKNVSMKESELVCWNIVVYDGKHLVVREMKDSLNGVVHVYDMEVKSWEVIGSTKSWSSRVRDFYKFTPSLFFVEEDEQQKVTVASNDKRIPYLTAIMGLIDTTK